MNETFEKAYQYDEALRFKKAIQKADLRDKHRKAILEEMARLECPKDYERPLLKVEGKRKKSGTIKRFLSSLLP